jgi:hypothetical protein
VTDNGYRRAQLYYDAQLPTDDEERAERRRARQAWLEDNADRLNDEARDEGWGERKRT